MADPRQQAVEIAQTYDQGPIDGLDDTMTRRLVASVVFTGRRGGDPEAVDRFGHLGRYQVGAGWLVQAGLVDPARRDAAMAAEGARNERQWARDGGMDRFLREPAHWTGGASREVFLATSTHQDRAFRDYCGHQWHRALDEGLLREDDPGRKVAGFLKVCHVTGYGDARAVVTGGRVQRDAAGVSNYDLFHDISRNRDGLDAHFGLDARRASLAPGDAPSVAAQIASTTAMSNTATPRPLTDPAHAGHGLFRQATTQLESLGAAGGFASRQELEQAAAAIAAAAHTAGLRELSYLGRTHAPDGRSWLVAVQGDPGDPAAKSAYVDHAAAIRQPIEQSRRAIEPDASSVGGIALDTPTRPFPGGR